MRTYHSLLRVMTLVAALLVVAACGQAGSDPTSTTTEVSTPATSVGGAPDLLAAVQEAGVLKVGVYQFQPWSGLDAGEWSGIMADVTSKLGEELGVEIEPTVLQAAAYVPSIDSGRIDLMVGISKTEERAEVADFSEPILYAPDAVAVHSDSDFESLEDLSGASLGIVRGTWGETLSNILIDNGALAPGKVTTYDNYDTPLLDINNGRLDSNVSDVVGINYAVEQNPDLNLKAIFIPPEAAGFELYDSMYYLAQKGNASASLLNEINLILERFREDGTLASIYESYGLGDYTEALLTGTDPGN